MPAAVKNKQARWITAKFWFWCACCGDRVEKGQRAWYRPKRRGISRARAYCEACGVNMAEKAKQRLDEPARKEGRTHGNS